MNSTNHTTQIESDKTTTQFVTFPQNLRKRLKDKEPGADAISACFQVRPEPFGKARTLIVETLSELNLQNRGTGGGSGTGNGQETPFLWSLNTHGVKI